MRKYPKLSAVENGLAKIVSRTRSAANVISITILTFCLIFGLSACGGDTSGGKNSERTEKQISEDVQAKDNYFSKYNLKVDSISISKRQTNQEAKTDFVWCTVAASNNDFSYSAEYELTYVLYNDGWLLEEYSQESSSVIPKSLPTQTQDEAWNLVEEEFKNSYYKRSGVHDASLKEKSDLKKVDDLTYSYYFRIYFKEYLNGYNANYHVTYRFDLASGQWNSEVTHRLGY